MYYKFILIFSSFVLNFQTAKAQDSLATFADLVPFVTTPDEVVDAMLELGEVDPTDRIIDLGSGDGRIPIRPCGRSQKQGQKGGGLPLGGVYPR